MPTSSFPSSLATFSNIANIFFIAPSHKIPKNIKNLLMTKFIKKILEEQKKL